MTASAEGIVNRRSIFSCPCSVKRSSRIHQQRIGDKNSTVALSVHAQRERDFQQATQQPVPHGGSVLCFSPFTSAIFLGLSVSLCFQATVRLDEPAFSEEKRPVIIGEPVQECEYSLKFRLRCVARTLSMGFFRLVIFRQPFSVDISAHDPDPMAQAEPGIVHAP